MKHNAIHATAQSGQRKKWLWVLLGGLRVVRRIGCGMRYGWLQALQAGVAGQRP